jgi:hypothetical protein
MKKETIEEAAERLYPTPKVYELYSDIGNSMRREAFIAGVKWQQEQDREMEKERIMQAYNDGKAAVTVNYKKNMSLEEYYNENYKNKTK